jgi:hypothetical protein
MPPSSVCVVYKELTEAKIDLDHLLHDDDDLIPSSAYVVTAAKTKAVEEAKAAETKAVEEAKAACGASLSELPPVPPPPEAGSHEGR